MHIPQRERMTHQVFQLDAFGAEVALGIRGERDAGDESRDGAYLQNEEKCYGRCRVLNFPQALDFRNFSNFYIGLYSPGEGLLSDVNL